jgi:trehalose 6-phosphate synthase/phosphatase
MTKLIIVSNRSPVTVQRAGAATRFEFGAGRLATGLRGLHEQSGGAWVGWGAARRGHS